MIEIKKLLSEGLAAGFAGGSSNKIDRGGFAFKVGHLNNGNGTYHDEWIADRVGGGQETVRTKDGQEYTRLYAGGTISEEELKKLGINKKDVLGFLVNTIQKLGEDTRLFMETELDSGDWRYTYEITSDEEKIPLTAGEECIFYKDNLVFVHNFLLCPIE